MPYSAIMMNRLMNTISRLNPTWPLHRIMEQNAHKTSKRICPRRPRSSMFKRRLIAADQALVFIAMMSAHISSGLVLHQMTSDHNRSELRIHDHSNDIQVKAVPKFFLSKQTATSNKSWNYIPPS
ncbi:hypothetical protein Tco_1411217 [Tanacetum coccineum]